MTVCEQQTDWRDTGRVHNTQARSDLTMSHARQHVLHEQHSDRRMRHGPLRTVAFSNLSVSDSQGGAKMHLYSICMVELMCACMARAHTVICCVCVHSPCLVTCL